MNRRAARRRAYTLIELVASMAGAAALMGGISSTMFIALRASNPATTPAPAMLQALGRLADMAAELQYAQAISESTAIAVTVTVPDRSDAGTAPETIRYAWSGTAGAPLTRSFNGGAAESVIPSVESLALQYSPSAPAPKYITVRIQPTATANSAVETSISFLNL